jgi:phage regulator Rha-like protein
MAAPKWNGLESQYDQPAKILKRHADDFTHADSDLALTTTMTGVRVSSQAIAAHLGVKHQSFFELLKKYRSDFETFGILRFQTGVIDGRGRPGKLAMLTEDQSLLALTYSRNTDRVRHLKIKLVKAFGEARRAADMRQTEYLPSYHHLHDQIKAQAAGSSNQRFDHMNINKLLNKVAGIEAGQRAAAPVPKQGLLIAGQMLMAAAMQSAKNSKEAYRLAFQAVQPLANAVLALAAR